MVIRKLQRTLGWSSNESHGAESHRPGKRGFGGRSDVRLAWDDFYVATSSDFHAGRAPGNKGQRYAADPPTVDEIIAVMRHARHIRYGNRLNGLIVVLWRAASSPRQPDGRV